MGRFKSQLTWSGTSQCVWGGASLCNSRALFKKVPWDGSGIRRLFGGECIDEVAFLLPST